MTSFNIVKAAVKGMIKEEGQQQHAGASGTSSSPHRRGGGSIVLVSAALASHGIPNYEAMSAAKAAVEGECTIQALLRDHQGRAKDLWLVRLVLALHVRS